MKYIIKKDRGKFRFPFASDVAIKYYNAEIEAKRKIREEKKLKK